MRNLRNSNESKWNKAKVLIHTRAGRQMCFSISIWLIDLLTHVMLLLCYIHYRQNKANVVHTEQISEKKSALSVSQNYDEVEMQTMQFVPIWLTPCLFNIYFGMLFFVDSRFALQLWVVNDCKVGEFRDLTLKHEQYEKYCKWKTNNAVQYQQHKIATCNHIHISHVGYCAAYAKWWSKHKSGGEETVKRNDRNN